MHARGVCGGGERAGERSRGAVGVVWGRLRMSGAVGVMWGDGECGGGARKGPGGWELRYWQRRRQGRLEAVGCCLDSQVDIPFVG